MYYIIDDKLEESTYEECLKRKNIKKKWPFELDELKEINRKNIKVIDENDDEIEIQLYYIKNGKDNLEKDKAATMWDDHIKKYTKK